MFWSMMDMANLNAFIIFSKLPQVDIKRKGTLLMFKKNLIQQISWKYGSIIAIQKQGPTRFVIDDMTRFKTGNHFPDYYEEITHGSNNGRKKRKPCKVCNNQTEKSEEMKARKGIKMIDQYCTLCNVPLCTGICWWVYHSIRDWRNYNLKVKEVIRRRSSQNMNFGMANMILEEQEQDDIDLEEQDQAIMRYNLK